MKILLLLTVFIPVIFRQVSHKTLFVAHDITPERYQIYCTHQLPCVGADVDPLFEYQVHEGYQIEMVIMYLDWNGDTAIFFPWDGCVHW